MWRLRYKIKYYRRKFHQALGLCHKCFHSWTNRTRSGTKICPGCGAR